jgi:crossover junction endodeoxyribonuclease RuvC
VQVAHMIKTLLQLEGKISPDASDALAIAVCHAHTRRLHQLAAGQ